MSYNIDVFRLKKLDNLRIPVFSLYRHHRADWHPERTNNDDGTVTFEVLESKVSGIILGGTLHVKSISCRGEGSGTAMEWIFEPALKDSRGELVASCVWEGGDSINRLTVKDGEVTWEDIDI